MGYCPRAVRCLVLLCWGTALSKEVVLGVDAVELGVWRSVKRSY